MDNRIKLMIVKIDVTAHFGEDIQRRVGKIWSVFMYDENRTIFIGSLKRGYHLRPVDYFFEASLPEKEKEVLDDDIRACMSGFSSDYHPVNIIDSLPANQRKLFMKGEALNLWKEEMGYGGAIDEAIAAYQADPIWS